MVNQPDSVEHQNTVNLVSKSKSIVDSITNDAMVELNEKLDGWIDDDDHASRPPSSSVTKVVQSVAQQVNNYSVTPTPDDDGNGQAEAEMKGSKPNAPPVITSTLDTKNGQTQDRASGQLLPLIISPPDEHSSHQKESSLEKVSVKDPKTKEKSMVQVKTNESRQETSSPSPPPSKVPPINRNQKVRNMLHSMDKRNKDKINAFKSSQQSMSKADLEKGDKPKSVTSKITSLGNLGASSTSSTQSLLSRLKENKKSKTGNESIRSVIDPILASYRFKFYSTWAILLTGLMAFSVYKPIVHWGEQKLESGFECETLIDLFSSTGQSNPAERRQHFHYDLDAQSDAHLRGFLLVWHRQWCGLHQRRQATNGRVWSFLLWVRKISYCYRCFYHLPFSVSIGYEKSLNGKVRCILIDWFDWTSPYWRKEDKVSFMERYEIIYVPERSLPLNTTLTTVNTIMMVGRDSPFSYPLTFLVRREPYW